MVHNGEYFSKNLQYQKHSNVILVGGEASDDLIIE